MKNKLLFFVRLVVAIILLQTLFFKFTAHPESVELFSRLVGPDLEGLARISTGILELIASVLLLLASTQVIGAIMVVFIMVGALVSHVMVLGFDSLFFLALIAFFGALYVVINQRKTLYGS